MNITEQELFNIGFIRKDWIHGDEDFHDYILEGNSVFKIEVYDDFSSSLIVGHECRALPSSTGLEEFRSLAKILNIVPKPTTDLATETREKIYQDYKFEAQ